MNKKILNSTLFSFFFSIAANAMTLENTEEVKKNNNYLYTVSDGSVVCRIFKGNSIGGIDCKKERENEYVPGNESVAHKLDDGTVIHRRSVSGRICYFYESYISGDISCL